MSKSTRTINIFLKKYVKSQARYYQSLLKDYQNDMNRTWQLLKKITGKSKLKSKRFLKSINVNGKTIKKIQ